jgi:hypothetical protein
MEPRTSSLSDKISRQFSHPDAYPTVAPRLSDGSELPHTTSYIFNYNNISFRLYPFIHPTYLWPNSSCAVAHELNKQENTKRQKAKNRKRKSKGEDRPGGDRISDIESIRQDMASIFTW